MNISSIGRYNYYAYQLNNRVNQSNQQSYSNLSNSNIYNSFNRATIQQNSAASVNSAIAIRSDADELIDTTKKLRNSLDSGTFSQKTASSSDESKVSTAVTDGALNGVYSVAVSQIAQAQVNTGNALNKQQISNVQAGGNVISIKTGNVTKDVAFSISSGDTNETVLNKMAKAINDSKSGVTATVVKSTANNEVKIQLSSDKTGTSNSFAVTDKTGNAVANTGLNSTTVQSQNAKYTVNNVEYTSDSNQVSVQNGKVKFNLKQKTANPVEVTVKSDTNKIESTIETFVQNYNKLVSDVQNNNSSNAAVSSLVKSVSKDKSKLEAIGINLNEDNTLTVNKEKLQKSLDTSVKNVRDTISGYNGIAAKAENAAKYVAKNSFAVAGINSFDTYNSGMMMAYSYASQGSIFNLYG